MPRNVTAGSVFPKQTLGSESMAYDRSDELEFAAILAVADKIAKRTRSKFVVNDRKKQDFFKISYTDQSQSHQHRIVTFVGGQDEKKRA